MKTTVNPAPNYLLVYQVDIKDFNILNGLVAGKDKDVVAKIGYIEKCGKNCDLANDTRLVVFNGNLSTTVRENTEYAYLIHKSSILATIPGGTIVYQKISDNGWDFYEVEVDEKTYGMSLNNMIDKFGHIIEHTVGIQ